MSKEKEFAILQEVKGRQILFLAEKDDEDGPCITTKTRADIGLVSFTASGYGSEDQRDEAFQKLKGKSGAEIQEQLDTIDKMVDEMLGK